MAYTSGWNLSQKYNQPKGETKQPPAVQGGSVMSRFYEQQMAPYKTTKLPEYPTLPKYPTYPTLPSYREDPRIAELLSSYMPQLQSAMQGQMGMPTGQQDLIRQQAMDAMNKMYFGAGTPGMPVQGQTGQWTTGGGMGGANAPIVGATPGKGAGRTWGGLAEKVAEYATRMGTYGSPGSMGQLLSEQVYQPYSQGMTDINRQLAIQDYTTRMGNLQSAMGQWQPQYLQQLTGRGEAQYGRGTDLANWRLAQKLGGYQRDVQQTMGPYERAVAMATQQYQNLLNQQQQKGSDSNPFASIIGTILPFLIMKSDRKLKENIVSFNDGLDKVEKLQPVRFDYINKDKNQVGFIAQDVQKVIPEAVVQMGNATLGINYAVVIPYLVNAVKELTAKVEALGG